MLQKNLDALRAVNPTLADIIEKAPVSDWVQSIQGKHPNLILTHGIKRHTVYSDKDPEQDAVETIKNIEFHSDDATIIIGMGLGYALKHAIKKSKKGHMFVVLEPSADIIKKAFELHDFSDVTIKNQLYIAMSQNDTSIIVSLLDNQSVISNWQMIMSKYCTFKANIYMDIIEHATSLINQLYCNTGTVMGAGAKIALNDIDNFPYTIGEPGIELLFNKYKGKTAVMVSTGPSLQKNIHLLMDPKNRDHVIIIAVAQALRILLAYDIKPDFVCTVDYGEVNLSHFDGLMDCDVPLVALNRTYAPILKQWQGKKFIVGTPVPGYDNSSSALISAKGSVEQGGSVSHLCMGLAIAMGCKNIIIIGQDLAYDNNRSHNPNADSGGHLEVIDNQIWWIVDDQRSHLSGENKKHSMGMAHYVDGYFGGMSLTNLGLASFITAFKNIVARHPKINFINSTEGGAHIEGTSRMTLKKALKKYRNIFLDKNIADRIYQKYDGSGEFVKSLKVLEDEIKLYSDIIENAEKAISSNKKIKKTRDTAEIKKLIKDNEKYSTEAEMLSRKNPLIQVAIYNESRKIQARDLKVKGNVAHLIKSQKDLNTRLDRNKLILEAAIREAGKLKKSTESVYELMKEVVENNNPDLLKDKTPYVPNIDDAEGYFKNGNFARPLLDAKRIFTTNAMSVYGRAVSMRQEVIDKAIEHQEKMDYDLEIEYLTLVSDAIKIGKKLNSIKSKDYKEPMMLLKRAEKLKPEELMPKWGIATIYHYMGDNDKSVKLYGELVEKFPDNISMQFERATVMINLDIKKALFLFCELFKKTDDYDWYFSRIADLYLIIGDKNMAIEFLCQYLVDNQNDHENWKKLSEVYDQIGDKPNATKAYKKYMDIIGK